MTLLRGIDNLILISQRYIVLTSTEIERAYREPIGAISWEFGDASAAARYGDVGHF